MNVKKRKVVDKVVDRGLIRLDMGTDFWPSNLVLVYQNEIYKVHRDIVCLASRVLAVACEVKESKSDDFQIEIPTIKEATGQHFEHFIKRIYKIEKKPVAELYLGVLYLSNWAGCPDLIKEDLHYSYKEKLSWNEIQELSAALQNPGLLAEAVSRIKQTLWRGSEKEKQAIHLQLSDFSKDFLIEIIKFLST